MNHQNNETTVINLRVEAYDIYIGRGSIWGNPFTHKKGTKAEKLVKSRAEAIAYYRNYLLSRPDLIERIEELRGKRLGCYCKPCDCHGDVIVDILRKIENPKSEIEDHVFW